MNELPRILIIENSRSDAEMIEHEFYKSLGDCKILHVDTRQDYVEALGRFNADIVLADYKLPEFSGLEALKLALDKLPSTPVLIFTNASNEENAVECIKAGAANYVLKEDIKRLGPAAIHALEEKRIQAERLLANDKLQKTEERYYNTLDNMFESCQIIDFEWRYLYLNKAAEILNRRPNQELLREKITEAWPEFETTELFNLLKLCMKERIPIRAEVEFSLLDQSIVWLDTNLHPIPEGICILSVEVSKGKKAEKSLQLFHTLLDQSPDAIEVVDLEKDRFIDANEAAWQGLGYSREEFLSIRFGDLVLDSSLAGKVVEELKTQAHIVLEGLHKRKDGTTFPVELHIRSIQPDRKFQVIIARDITQRRNTEDILRQRNEELARLYKASSSLLAANPMSITEQANTIISIIQQEFGQSNCSLFLVQKGSDELRQIAIVGPYSDQIREKVLRSASPGIITESIRLKKVINVPDVSILSDYFPEWKAARAEMAIPLMVESEVIGVIDLQCAEIGAFTSDDERIMSIFSERAALALERSRLNVQTESRLQQLMSLRTIDRAISSSFDITLTLNVLLNEVMSHLNIHAVDILVYSPQTQILQLCAENGFRLPRVQHSFVQFRDDFAWQVIHARATIEVNELDKTMLENSYLVDIEKEGFQSYLGVPLIAKGQVKGVLEIYQRESLQFSQDQRSFLEMLAGQAAIAVDNAQLFENIQGYNAELTLAYDETIQGWSQAMDLRDKETEGHSKRVTEWTMELAPSFGVKPAELVHIRRGALLHDIGKIGVPDEILRKPSALTEEEWSIMQKHPQFAFDMLFPITYLHPALDIPYCHHEKWNGTGYPRKLKGKQIPLAARIFAVVDVWDALTSDRPYRKAWSKEDTVNYIREQSGKHFDPEIVERFLEKFHSG